MDNETGFLDAFKGSFTSTMRWHQLDALWGTVREQPSGWYVYAVGEPPPVEVADAQALKHFVDEIDGLLRGEHKEDYCGIVYADSLAEPSMIKIYDPNNLGVSCGFSDNPPLPGWILSRILPIDLHAARQTGSRRRWWQRLWTPS